jgi:GNAT superfamily N-acetyltransferase
MTRPRTARSYSHTLRDGRVVCLRNVVPADGPEIIQAFGRLSSEARYSRFMHYKQTLGTDEVNKAIQPRPGVACVIVAIDTALPNKPIVGGAQYVPDGEAGGHRVCEFALTVADDWQHSGLGRLLLASVVRRARRDGYLTIQGLVLAGNASMLALAHKLKFKPQTQASNPGVVVVSRSLIPQARQSRLAMLMDSI